MLNYDILKHSCYYNLLIYRYIYGTLLHHYPSEDAPVGGGIFLTDFFGQKKIHPSLTTSKEGLTQYKLHKKQQEYNSLDDGQFIPDINRQFPWLFQSDDTISYTSSQN